MRDFLCRTLVRHWLSLMNHVISLDPKTPGKGVFGGHEFCLGA